MDSPAARPEAAAGVLDTRRRLRLVAITLWTGFLGAALTVVTAVALLPPGVTHELGWAELSIGFLVSWVLAMVSISLALMLALPADSISRGR